uniref:Uncharacterized protein n=1 Tax=Rhizophora mucronata TaxID=61149 RepID=A0A2P2Q2R2_RHIMU
MATDCHCSPSFY